MARFANAATALVIAAITAGCSTPTPKAETLQKVNRDALIGTILRRHAVQRSLEDCKVSGVNMEQCNTSLNAAQKHLDSVNDRIEVLLKDPKTNMCDLVRWAGSCNNPIYTLGDLADCLQVAADRGEALNSGRFTLKVDSHGCPTDAK
jgi:hypothetical protein